MTRAQYVEYLRRITPYRNIIAAGLFNNSIFEIVRFLRVQMRFSAEVANQQAQLFVSERNYANSLPTVF